jgi:site-specific recombinase XerC
LDRGELLVRYGKGRKSRRVPIEDADLIAGLSRLCNVRKDGLAVETSLAKPIFVGPRGTKLSHTSF